MAVQDLKQRLAAREAELQQVRGELARVRMADDSSALLNVMTRDRLVDRCRLLGILTLFEGKVFETTLPMEVEAALEKGWEA